MRGRCFLFICAVVLCPAPGPAQPASNQSLQGSYHFRYLGIIGSPCDCPISFQGTVVFDGRGTFQITGQGTYNNGSDHTLNGPGSGNYQVLPSGMLQMGNPFANGAASLHGGIGAGALVASSTESGYLDLLVATPAGTGSSNGILNGTYRLAHLEFAGGSPADTRNTFFAVTADGAGGMGNVTIGGTSQTLNGVPTTQSISGATYTISANGSGALNLPAPGSVSTGNQLLAGNKTLYVSRDGGFLFGGSVAGYDLILGVKALPANSGSALAGLYFTGALQNLADASAGAGIYSSWGSSNATGDAAGNELAHQRVNANGYGQFDQTFSDIFKLNPDGTVSYPSSKYALGAGGNIAIGSGNGANYQLALNVKIPAMSGSGVFVNPLGVVNAASSIPFTAPISPGEVVTLYGSGLASQTLTAPSLPFPTSLGSVQVSINGTAAPLYYVSPTLISAVVPYSIPGDGSLATIQVTFNGAISNSVQVYTGQTSPGLFTLPAGGLGNGAILHADFSTVSPANPARAGETVQIYLTGLGAVAPALPAGTAAPLNPLSMTANHVAVYIDKQPAKVAFEGLAPTLAGLYQLNVTIPAGVSAGNVDVEIVTIGASNVQATIPIAR